MNRRFVRSVRRAAPDRPGACAANRSITDGCSSTLRHRVQSQPDAVARELAGRPQQALGPVLVSGGAAPPPPTARTPPAAGEVPPGGLPPRQVGGHLSAGSPLPYMLPLYRKNVHSSYCGLRASAGSETCVAWNHPPAAAVGRPPPSSPPRPGLALPGTLTVRSYACGKPRCRCHADPPQLHGPYAEWTRKIDGKTVTRRLTPEQIVDWQPLFDNPRRCATCSPRSRTSPCRPSAPTTT